MSLRIYSAVRRTFSRWWLRGFNVALGSILLLLLVPAVHAGTLGLAWNAPTTNTDGSALTDLSGYRVYTGTSSSVACPGSSYQAVPSPTSTPVSGAVMSYSVTGLTTGTTYFAQVTAVEQPLEHGAQRRGFRAHERTPPCQRRKLRIMSGPSGVSTLSG